MLINFVAAAQLRLGDSSCIVATRATGFATAAKRSDHWQAHGTEFPEISDEVEYERRAVAFMNGSLGSTVLECVRACDGDTVRYDPATNTIAFMRSDGKIRTFFRPNPSWHGLGSNLRYFQRECAK